jgi:hypothetical protein
MTHLIVCYLLISKIHFFWGGVEPSSCVEQSLECLAGETEVLGENLHQCRFVHHKILTPGSNPGLCSGNRRLIA